MQNRFCLYGCILALLTIGLCSCASIPEGITPVEDFSLESYLGTWYEIARFDFRFEKDLSHVTATYSLNEDGTVKVVNTGYNTKKDKWQEALGKARFRGDNTVRALEVSFFGPFYTGYNVLKIDQEYTTALVGGKNFDYLWILSRTPEISEEVKQEYLEYAQALGYDVSNLVWVEQNSLQESA